MKGFLSRLEEAMKNPSDKPTDSFKPVKATDKVLGRCSPRARMIFMLAKELQQRTQDINLCLEGEDAVNTSPMVRKWLMDLVFTRMETKALVGIFWVIAREELPSAFEWDTPICIREGCVLVIPASAEDEGDDCVRFDIKHEPESAAELAVVVSLGGQEVSSFGDN